MNYKLIFKKEAMKELKKLDKTIAHQLLKKLQERCQQPHIPSARLNNMPNCYKIKLRKSGYRLVYQVIDERIVVKVIAVGKRERSEVYEMAMIRLQDKDETLH
ncbi:type II toxin-antitoxin system RelE family toxin [Lonepinella sp. BR2474]|uniref:type II toxin-antitoxin system RelE family toxin n=1 Tax=Lonepinella sp. BR2474 TaxID=3434548 RepID=UPI003F6DBA12